MVALARSTRSGVVESIHHGDAVAVSADGEILRVWGDPTERSFYRSAIKPFQATVSQRNGAALAPEQMALACASHGAFPVHLAIVRSMLVARGLSTSDLGTPPDIPGTWESAMQAASAGRGKAASLYHNCSGKHAAFLRACVVSDWPTASYLQPDHPLQKQVMQLVSEVTEEPVTPLGVDGCGAPAPSGTVLGLARGFAKLTSDPEFADAASAMSRFPSLVSSIADGRIGAWWGGPVKRGAKGMLAAGRHGIGIAVKSREGSTTVAAVGMIAIMKQMGLLSPAAQRALQGTASPPVYGGGRPVGALEPTLEESTT